MSNCLAILTLFVFCCFFIIIIIIIIIFIIILPSVNKWGTHLAEIFLTVKIFFECNERLIVRS